MHIINALFLKHKRVFCYSKCCLFSLSAILAIAFFTNCASSPIDLYETQSFPESEGVVFGRVKVIRNEKVENLSTIFGESKMSVVILPDDSRKGIYFPLVNDGYFYWHLPPDGYIIAAFKRGIGGVGSSGRICVHFNVLENEVTYIGTLELTFCGYSYRFLVDDEYEFAVERFRKEFPQFRREIKRKLMKMEKQR